MIHKHIYTDTQRSNTCSAQIPQYTEWHLGRKRVVESVMFPHHEQQVGSPLLKPKKSAHNEWCRAVKDNKNVAELTKNTDTDRYTSQLLS